MRLTIVHNELNKAVSESGNSNVAGFFWNDVERCRKMSKDDTLLNNDGISIHNREVSMNMEKTNKLSGLCNLFLPFLGAVVGASLASHFNRIIYFFAGLLAGVMLACLYGCIRKASAANESNQIVNQMAENPNDILINESIEKIEQTLRLRKAACERLRVNEFWIQIINIYYSCFTAVLAICSLREFADFIALPSAIFTVVVALLVTFANSQRYGDRANDLKANCIDIQLSLNQCRMLKEKICAKNPGLNSGQYWYDEEDRSALKKIMEEYIKKLGDSENSGIAEKWKYGEKCDLPKYYIYILIKALFIIALLLVPIAFVLVNYSAFLQLFLYKR